MKISVAMAVYNGERFIREQLDSFACQIRLPDEMVVSDDVSTDRTLDLVREFAARVPFPVRLLVNRQNVKTNKNFERAIDACTGDIIFTSDWDDVQYPDKLLLMERALQQSPRAGVAICNADLVDQNLKPLGKTLWQAHRFFPSRRLQNLMRQGLAFTSSITTNGCCLAFRRELKDVILPLPGGDPRDIVWDAFVVWTAVLSGAGGVALVDRPLFAYRQHGAQVSGAGGNTYSRLGLWRERLARASERPRLNPLIQRLESPAAVRSSRNQEIRDSVLRHWHARKELPKSRAARLPAVIRELLSSRYHRFSHGFGAAAKDLLFVH